MALDWLRWTPAEVRWALAVRWWLSDTPALALLPEGLRRPSLSALGALLGLWDGPGVSQRLYEQLEPEEAAALVLAGAIFPELPFRQGGDPAEATLAFPWGLDKPEAGEDMSPVRLKTGLRGILWISGPPSSLEPQLALVTFTADSWEVPR